MSCSEPPPTTPVVPPTPPPADPNTPFVAQPLLNTVYIGYGSMTTPDSAPRAWDPANCAVTIGATGTLRGSVRRVTARMTDRESGSVLGSYAKDGPFLDYNPEYGTHDLLLETGHQIVGAWDSNRMGFVGRPATLSFEIVVKDTNGKEWTVTASIAIERFPQPIVRSPVGATVRQNDPSSGCPFDAVHGYGIVVDVRWDPPPGAFSINHYVVSIADGAGTELISPYTYKATTDTSYRLVTCGAHVPMGAERGARVAVQADGNDNLGLSGFAVAHFDFQSCREGGTPACQ